MTKENIINYLHLEAYEGATEIVQTTFIGNGQELIAVATLINQEITLRFITLDGKQVFQSLLSKSSSIANLAISEVGDSKVAVIFLDNNQIKSRLFNVINPGFSRLNTVFEDQYDSYQYSQSGNDLAIFVPDQGHISFKILSLSDGGVSNSGTIKAVGYYDQYTIARSQNGFGLFVVNDEGIWKKEFLATNGYKEPMNWRQVVISPDVEEFLVDTDSNGNHLVAYRKLNSNEAKSTILVKSSSTDTDGGTIIYPLPEDIDSGYDAATITLNSMVFDGRNPIICYVADDIQRLQELTLVRGQYELSGAPFATDNNNTISLVNPNLARDGNGQFYAFTINQNAIPSQTSSRTPSPSQTPSRTLSPSQTPSRTPSPSQTPSRTPSITPSLSRTPSISPSLSVTPTVRGEEGFSPIELTGISTAAVAGALLLLCLIYCYIDYQRKKLEGWKFLPWLVTKINPFFPSALGAPKLKKNRIRDLENPEDAKYVAEEQEKLRPIKPAQIPEDQLLRSEKQILDIHIFNFLIKLCEYNGDVTNQEFLSKTNEKARERLKDFIDKFSKLDQNDKNLIFKSLQKKFLGTEFVNINNFRIALEKLRIVGQKVVDGKIENTDFIKIRDKCTNNFDDITKEIEALRINDYISMAEKSDKADSANSSDSPRSKKIESVLANEKTPSRSVKNARHSKGYIELT